MADTGTVLSDGVWFALGSLLAVIASGVAASVTLRVEGKRRKDEQGRQAEERQDRAQEREDERQRWADERQDRAQEREDREQARRDALVIDRRRRADAERVRLDAARVTAYAAVLETALAARSAIQGAERAERADRSSDLVKRWGAGGIIDRFSVAIFSAQILATPPMVEALQALRRTVIDRYRAVRDARNEQGIKAVPEVLSGFSNAYASARDAFTEAANAELTRQGRQSAWSRPLARLREADDAAES